MINLVIKKKPSSKFVLIKVFIFTICISLLIKAAVSQATVVRSQEKKEKSNLFVQQISQMNSDNESLRLKNKNLRTSMKQNQILYREKLANTKIAYLTFDDGPSNNTLEILKILKKYNIKATFFVNGHPELGYLYKHISDDGHILANHTYSHEYKDVYTSADNFKKDVSKLDAFLTNITGKEPNHILRYPGGSNNTVSQYYGGKGIMDTMIKETNKEGYIYFDWNVDSTDASSYRQSKNKIVQAVLTESSRTKHPVVLMHDLNPKITTVQALPEIIEGLKKKGFIFDVLSENTYAPQFKVAT
ncbi:polysaccharide deacetylase [Clostridium algoriphilum]|uniref:polysaccharide deacetylase family protein n=1 Tax=Clostridium algoriphilum TaxID=198347 RepID=UPI001CF23A3F|nr:polysaccharide deacetylase family protein [Clostridium algoriphilum]MCB2293320.1 polysaccharide deacetylase [Clostridium algoriphilum]